METENLISIQQFCEHYSISTAFINELKEYELIEIIVNNNNGERLETYIIKGEEGTGVVCLNGAAARKVQKGDEIIIITFETIEKHKISFHKPTVIFPHNDNLLFQTNEDIVRELYEENILTVSQIAMKMGRTIEEVNEILKD